MRPLKRKQNEIRICNRAYLLLSEIDYAVSARTIISMLIDSNHRAALYRSNARLPMPPALTRMLRRDNRFRETHCQRGDTSLWEVRE